MPIKSFSLHYVRARRNDAMKWRGQILVWTELLERKMQIMQNFRAIHTVNMSNTCLTGLNRT